MARKRSIKSLSTINAKLKSMIAAPYPPEGYDFSFPTRWLWEDFEEELKTETEKAIGQIEKAKEKAKEKRLQKKASTKALQESVRQKLTKEELKIIKFVKV